MSAVTEIEIIPNIKKLERMWKDIEYDIKKMTSVISYTRESNG